MPTLLVNLLRQILCARLKILAMPLVNMHPPEDGVAVGGVAAEPAAAGEHAAHAAQPLQAQDREQHQEQQQPHQGAAAAAAGAAAAQEQADDGDAARARFAPNILRGYWERRPEQQRLLPRLR